MGPEPQVGLELVNPAAGTRVVFLATAESTKGAYLEIEATYPADSPPPPRHLHPSQDEQFTVLAGQLRATVGEQSHVISVGDELHVSKGTPHLMGAGEDGAVMRWRTSPALRTG
jgi:quercetin dioxygenase-like cupin family protein